MSMSYFEDVKELVKLNIPDELLKAVVFEMSRSFDNDFTKEIQSVQKEHDVVFDTPTRKSLRKKYYYGSYYNIEVPYQIRSCKYNDIITEKVFKAHKDRLSNYDSNNIIESMKRRIEALNNGIENDVHMEEWLKEFDKRRSDKLYSFLAFRLDQETFAASGHNENIITDFISKTYCGLENYRHLAIIVQGEIYNKNNECITWNLLYKAGIFAENFIQYKDKFFPFHKEKQINNLSTFLEERNIENAKVLAETFYSSISTGYRYEDCYISDNQDCKILIYKKIELDNTNIPCPSCNTTIQRGNSYPEMFLRSWECHNPACPDRSKSGRGKRFDEYGVYRYFKLVENDKDNQISNELYQAFRRDIFDHKNNWIEFLIKEYTYSNENIFMFNCDVKEFYNRNIVTPDTNDMQINENAVADYSQLPIVVFFDKLINSIKLKQGKKKIKEKIEIVNDNSSYYLQTIKPGQIGTAITSPPYYNAREYSQWSTLIMYYVDMIINCKAVFNSLAQNSYYLYNIGDIVSEDNVYVVSNMSKHRVQLGFLSCMIFELSGYTLTGNIIWDKGEVQSKRNSTVNLVSGYVKCVNCYEHIWVFRKGNYEKMSNSVERITPVFKINSKGENTYKHTAPYPIELVELVRPYVNKQLYILDPFLGSGTTLKWCKINNYKGIGTELNKTYYKLCKENILETHEQMTIFDIK